MKSESFEGKTEFSPQTDATLEKNQSNPQSLEKLIIWLKTVSNSSFPKVFNTSAHLFKEKSLLLVTKPTSSTISIQIIDLSSFTSQDKYLLINEEVNESNFDTNFLHNQTILFHNRLYFLKNCSISDDENVFIGDLALKKLLPIKSDETRPANFRINYSINLYQFKILCFGGLQAENLKPLNTLDSFDITTYRWEVIKTKGKSPDPRHSHSAIIINDILYIIGGTSSRDLFQGEGKLDDLFLLDLKTYTWTPIKTFGTIPHFLGYNYACAINERRLFVLWSERGFNDSGFEMQTSMLDLVNYEWEEALIVSKKPDFRFNAAFCYDSENKTLLLLGGFFFNKSEQTCYGNTLDRLKILDKNEYAPNSKIEAYNGEKIDVKNLGSFIANKFENFSSQNNNNKKNETLEFEDEELSFEELLEREKKLQEEEKNKDENKKLKKKKSKKKKENKRK